MKTKTITLKEQMDDITKDLVNKFFCRRVDEYTLSVCIYWGKTKELILEKYPNLFVLATHNLQNGNLQLDLQIK